MKRFVTIQEIAQLLDCSIKTVRRKVNKGLIPAIQLGGKGTHLRFDIDEVVRAVKSASGNPTSTEPAIKSKDIDGTTPTRSRKRSGSKPKWQQTL